MKYILLIMIFGNTAMTATGFPDRASCELALGQRSADMDRTFAKGETFAIGTKLARRKDVTMRCIRELEMPSHGGA